MNREAVADVFQRIGRAKASSREKGAEEKRLSKTVKRHSETPTSAHEPVQKIAATAKEPDVYSCAVCGAAMCPAMYMLGGIFAADDAISPTGHAGQKHIGNLYCCPACGSLRVKINAAGNKEERK